MKLLNRAVYWLALGVAVSAAEDLELRTLSGRPDMITGGSSLVGIGGTALDSVRITLDGRDITKAFRPGRTAGMLLGRVEGLKPGKNILEVRAGSKRARLELINSPITGPVISGRRQTPFVCQTEAAGLGPALDGDCSAKTKVAYFYKSIQPARAKVFKELDTSAPRTSDLAKTTTSDGKTMSYIVRRETGTINRAIYSIAFLHEPGEPLPDPWTHSPGWNGRLVYSFYGGCRAGYRQAPLLGGMEDGVLAKGYAEATSSLNVFGNNCDDVISAETAMMVKEHFIKNFGVPVHTIGNGGSGGSMQQHLIAQNYPGLLDAIIPAASYPDITTLVAPVADCTLLARAFEGASQPWTEEQKTAVSGFATWRTCGSWISSHFSPGWIEPGYCDASVPKDSVYDPVKNPRGVRCTLQDNQANVYGRDGKTGFAPRFVDNAGVQYGLAAFNAGKIDAGQFLELNERIGGFDDDGNVVPKRSVADPRALRIAYRTGRVNSGKGGLSSIPIIDVREYRDASGNIHDRVRSFETRARLIRANGAAVNHVILTNPRNVDVVQAMDQWLDRIEQDNSGDSAALKVGRNKPSDLVDSCWTAEGEKIAEPATHAGPGRCNQLYPAFADPRIAAGAPLTNDILKCALKPLRAEDYNQPLSDGQIKRLKAVFPQGVCDYSRPGEEQAGVPEPWKRY